MKTKGTRHGEVDSSNGSETIDNDCAVGLANANADDVSSEDSEAEDESLSRMCNRLARRKRHLARLHVEETKEDDCDSEYSDLVKKMKVCEKFELAEKQWKLSGSSDCDAPLVTDLTVLPEVVERGRGVDMDQINVTEPRSKPLPSFSNDSPQLVQSLNDKLEAQVEETDERGILVRTPFVNNQQPIRGSFDNVEETCTIDLTNDATSSSCSESSPCSKTLKQKLASNMADGVGVESPVVASTSRQHDGARFPSRTESKAVRRTSLVNQVSTRSRAKTNVSHRKLSLVALSSLRDDVASTSRSHDDASCADGHHSSGQTPDSNGSSYSSFYWEALLSTKFSPSEAKRRIMRDVRASSYTHSDSPNLSQSKPCLTKNSSSLMPRSENSLSPFCDGNLCGASNDDNVDPTSLNLANPEPTELSNSSELNLGKSSKVLNSASGSDSATPSTSGLSIARKVQRNATIARSIERKPYHPCATIRVLRSSKPPFIAQRVQGHVKKLSSVSTIIAQQMHDHVTKLSSMSTIIAQRLQGRVKKLSGISMIIAQQMHDRVTKLSSMSTVIAKRVHDRVTKLSVVTSKIMRSAVQVPLRNFMYLAKKKLEAKVKKWKEGRRRKLEAETLKREAAMTVESWMRTLEAIGCMDLVRKRISADREKCLSDSEPWKCPVCYRVKSASVKLSSMPCGHVLCHTCVVQVADMNATCPMCKKKFRKRQIISLYM